MVIPVTRAEAMLSDDLAKAPPPLSVVAELDKNDKDFLERVRVVTGAGEDESEDDEDLAPDVQWTMRFLTCGLGALSLAQACVLLTGAWNTSYVSLSMYMSFATCWSFGVKSRWCVNIL